MAEKIVQHRRKTASEWSSYTGPVAELVFDTTNNTFRAMNGSQAGGFRLARLNADASQNITNFLFSSNAVNATNTNGGFNITTNGTGIFTVNNSTPNPSNPLAHILRSGASADGAGVLLLENSNGINGTSVFIGVSGAGVGYNAANCVIGVFRSSVSGRSINAAGTINASGADYAEYMRKAYKFDLKKGDIAGIDKNGLLTLKYKDAVGFLVKSTDPCIVGGDAWGTEDALGIKKPIPPTDENSKDFKANFKKYEEELSSFNKIYEETRSWYDRMAFCGRCPANVYGANVGDYLLPIEKNGSVAFEAVSEKELNFEQYKKAVGKVIKILDDGRAEIIIKTI